MAPGVGAQRCHPAGAPRHAESAPSLRAPLVGAVERSTRLSIVRPVVPFHTACRGRRRRERRQRPLQVPRPRRRARRGARHASTGGVKRVVRPLSTYSASPYLRQSPIATRRAGLGADDDDAASRHAVFLGPSTWCAPAHRPGTQCVRVAARREVPRGQSGPGTACAAPAPAR